MKAFSGFVSNPSDRMIRNSAHNARNCGHVAESVCNSERGESQLEKHNRSSGGPDEGRLNNRKLHEPSHSALALRHTQRNWTQIGIDNFCSLATLRIQELSAWTTGIVSGGCGKRGNPSCRGGGAAVCPSLEQGVPKKPLFCAILRDVIISSHMVNALVQEITCLLYTSPSPRD